MLVMILEAIHELSVIGPLKKRGLFYIHKLDFTFLMSVIRLVKFGNRNDTKLFFCNCVYEIF